MADKTQNYNLIKPLASEFYDVGVQNSNMDKIDQELKRQDDELKEFQSGQGGKADLDANGKIPVDQLPDMGYIPIDQKGAAHGVATLDKNAKIPKGQLPDAEAKRVARFTVGTTTAGWTADKVDYLRDGTADQVEINAAITALPDDGGEVVVLDGTYNLTNSVLVKKNNVTLSGNGGSTILKRFFLGDSKNYALVFVSSSNNTIQFFSLDGAKGGTYDSSYGFGICVSNGSNNKIIGNEVNNNNKSAIYIFSSSNNIIIGNTGANMGSSGIALVSQSGKNKICNNAFENCKYQGVSLDSSENNTITGNIFEKCNAGIQLWSNSNGNTLIGNVCRNSNSGGQGININSSSNNTIIGNTCNDNFNGISLGSSSNNNTVSGNMCKENNNGISLDSNSNNNAVSGNVCKENSNGINISSSKNNTVTGNTCIRGNGTTGDYTVYDYSISLTNDAQNNLISSNNIMGKNYTNNGTGNTFANNKYN